MIMSRIPAGNTASATAESFHKDDHVVTPSGDLARVLQPGPTFIRLCYLDSLPGADAEFELHKRLLRRHVPGVDPQPMVPRRKGRHAG